MKEVLMLLLAMIIGFAGGTGMFALILHYCNLEVCQMLSKQWEKVLIRDIQGTSETAIRWPNKNLKKR